MSLVRVDTVGTAVFAMAVAIGIPLHDQRVMQVIFAVIAMVLFTIGAAGSL